MPAKSRIDGQKQCLSYLFLGKERGHFVPRSNRIVFDEGVQKEGVFCVFCGIDHVGLTSTVEALVFGSGRYALPVENVSQVSHRFVFKYGLHETALVSYDKESQFDIEPQAIGRAYDASEFRGNPKNLNLVANALANVGFRVTGPVDLDAFHRHHLRTIIMMRGRRLFPEDPTRPAVDGVRVDLSYIVG